MAGNTPHEAVVNFLEPVQEAVSCITTPILKVADGYKPAADPHVLLLMDGGPIRLKGDGRISFSMTHQYRIVEAEGMRGPWKVQSSGYMYAVYDEEEHEIFAYHWHPKARSAITYPHFHLEYGAHAARPEVNRAHFPSRRISVEEVIRLILESFPVEPLQGDWRDILSRTQGTYEDFRSWA